MKRKHANATPQFVISRLRSSRLSSHRPQHTNTKKVSNHRLPFFPQNTNYATTNDNQLNLNVDENVLLPTLPWTTYYQFTNPLSLPLKNIPEDNEL